MKYYIVYFFIIVSFFIMLIFPESVFEGACTGLLLWFETVLPTLLPFLIISGLLVNTPAIHMLVKITSPIFCRLFGVSKYGSFAILCGFLCGYPMGAKVTSDLFCSEKISSSEASYLLSFCNNTSPMFIISYVLYQHLNVPHLVLPALCILFLSPLLCSFLFRHFYCMSYHTKCTVSTERKNPPKTSSLLDECIMKSFETITKIGGYIILFSIITKLSSTLPLTNSFTEIIFLPFLEITNGVALIAQTMIPFANKFVVTMALISFGGWCSIAQTRCIVSEAKIPLFPYIIEKLITALVTSLLAYLFMKLY